MSAPEKDLAILAARLAIVQSMLARLEPLVAAGVTAATLPLTPEEFAAIGVEGVRSWQREGWSYKGVVLTFQDVPVEEPVAAGGA